jgi:hypothetical protein
VRIVVICGIFCAVWVAVLHVRVVPVYAQGDMLLHTMRSVPNAMLTNPVLTGDTAAVVVGIPALSSFYAGYRSSSLVYGDIFQPGNADSVRLLPQNAIDRMNPNNTFAFDMNAAILFVQARLNSGVQVNVSATERAFARIAYQQNLMNLVWNGNRQFIGQTVQFDGFSADAAHYREYALGVMLPMDVVDTNLRVGFKLKYLQGLGGVQTARAAFSLRTDEQSYALTASSDVRLNTAGIVPFPGVGGYLWSSAGGGLGADIGVTYRITPELTLAGSLMDLGAITWVHGVRNYAQNNVQFTYRGLEINSLSDFAANPATTFDAVRDSITRTFRVQEAQESFTQTLPARVFVSGAYKFSDADGLAAILHAELYKTPQYAVSLAYSRTIGSAVWLYVSYGVTFGAAQSFDNIGVGAVLRLGAFQLHLVSDNVVQAFGLRSARAGNVRVGMNLFF